MSVHLGYLAVGTSRDELAQESGHPWLPVILLHVVEHTEKPFMPSHRGLVDGFYEIMVGWFWNIEVMFEVQDIVNKFPVLLGSSGNPGFSCGVIHGSKSLGDDQICGRGGGNLFC